MFQFFTKTLMRRVVSLFFLVALAPIGIVAFVGFSYFSEALEEGAFNHLSTVNEMKRNQIFSNIREKLHAMKIISGSEKVTEAVSLVQAYYDSGGVDPDGPFDVASSEYKAIHDRINPFFKEYIKTYSYADTYLLNAAYGHVMYSVMQGKDLGTNLRVGPYKGSGLARLWSEALKEKRPVMVDFSDYAPTSKPVAFIGVPVFDPYGDIIAVLAFQRSAENIDVVVAQRTGMGETGESYLVGEDLLMRSHSKFENTPTILKRKIDTIAVRNALNGQTGSAIIQNYRGEKVLSCYNYIGLKDRLGLNFDWVIISEIDKQEAFAAISTLEGRILGLTLLLALLACVAGYFSARTIANPLKGLAKKVALMAEGDLTVTASPGKRSDEIGILMRSFHNMLGILQNQVHQILEGANALSASITQISTSATDFATSSSETSSSVSEITTTVEEVRQTAQLSNEKAKHVAEISEKSSQDAEDGKKATGDAVTGMNRIKEEMEYVAEGIVKLSDQTQSIGEIIGAVNDLADQSNLLSVNASIEAAKAGEHGRGFAVVAQEMKSLADQSKEATDQVRGILSEIQKATSAAVMATERGNKTVEEGTQLAGQAGDSIDILSKSITESAYAALQITASNRQQLLGMNQLVQAIASIKDLSIQNMESARQLEGATRGLQDLGQKLKDLAGQFRV